MGSIRVAIGEMPRLIREIVVGLIAAEQDMEIVGEEQSTSALLQLVEEARPDVVVLDQESADLPEAGRRLFAERQRLKLLVLAGDGRTASLHQLEAAEVALGTVSPARLVDVIRAASRQEPAP